VTTSLRTSAACKYQHTEIFHHLSYHYHYRQAKFILLFTIVAMMIINIKNVWSASSWRYLLAVIRLSGLHLMLLLGDRMGMDTYIIAAAIIQSSMGWASGLWRALKIISKRLRSKF